MTWAVCFPAGLSCQACDESAQKFLAAPFPGAIVLVRDTFLPCVHHVDMTLEFEARGAKAVVVSNDGDYFRLDIVHAKALLVVDNCQSTSDCFGDYVLFPLRNCTEKPHELY